MDLFQKCYDFDLADQVRATGLYPFFKAMEGSFGAHAVYDGRRVIMVGSNNYLGLTDDPRLKQAAEEAIRQFGTSSCGSRLLNGNTVLHDELERSFAEFVGKEDALVFATGFLTNYGVLSCLAEKGSYIVSDAENHGSIIAGCRGSNATILKYHHNDMNDLWRILSELPQDAPKLVVSDAVFSMTGGIVNLPELVRVKKKNPNTGIYLDDAHGMGVLGDHGRGTANYFGLTDEVDLIMGTFSKAFASIGGAVAGPRKVIDYLRHHSHGFILSAALPAASAAAALKAIEIVKAEPQLINRLWNNVNYIKKGFKAIGLPFIESKTPILSIFIGEEGKAMQFVKALFERDIFATPVIYPAVPYGQAMIRTSYTASHTEEDLEDILKAMVEVALQNGILKKQTQLPKDFRRRSSYWNLDSILRTKEL